MGWRLFFNPFSNEETTLSIFPYMPLSSQLAQNRSGSAKKKCASRPKGKGKEWLNHNFRKCAMQTTSFLLFRLQESGLGSQDILLEKPWKLWKKYAGIIFTLRENSNICFFVLIIRFRQFGADFFSSNYLKVVRNYLKCGKNFLKNYFFPFTPSTRIRMKIFAWIRICKKKRIWNTDFFNIIADADTGVRR